MPGSHPTEPSTTALLPWYTSDLTALAACVNPHPPPLPEKLTQISTPLNHQAWQLWLNDHPDQAFASYLLDGIANGFRIGFAHNSNDCVPAKTNHPSAIDHPTVISEGLQSEVNKGRLIGTLDPKSFPYVQISSLSCSGSNSDKSIYS